MKLEVDEAQRLTLAVAADLVETAELWRPAGLAPCALTPSSTDQKRSKTDLDDDDDSHQHDDDDDLFDDDDDDDDLDDDDDDDDDFEDDDDDVAK